MLEYKPRRVVVTGVGVVSSIGSTKEAFWNGLITGKNGIGPITRMDVTDYTTKFGGEARDYDPAQHIDPKELRHMDHYTQLAMGAGIQAIQDSGINFDLCDRDRIGVIVGSGIGGMETMEKLITTIAEKGPRRISPFAIPMMISDIAAGHISIMYNLRGPNYATVSACATASHAIGLAMKTIRWGDADVVISGGAESPICPTGLGGFCALRALSTRNDDPAHASRPFDAKRDGFVMAEGAGIVVLEALEHAQARGAYIYGEVAGAGFTADAYHITAPPDDGNGAARAMAIALKDAGLNIEDIGYINAHGTSTPLNDKCETLAIKTIFGEHAKKLIVSSTKSMHGHMLGAAGGVELVATLLAMNHSIIPPTINYEFPDPELDLNYAPNKAIAIGFDAALSNNFGFGGHNACIAVKKFS